MFARQELTHHLTDDGRPAKAAAREERLEIKIAYSLKARQERRYLNLELVI